MRGRERESERREHDLTVRNCEGGSEKAPE